MEEYAKDMTAATIESHDNSWKLGIWLNINCIPPNIAMNG